MSKFKIGDKVRAITDEIREIGDVGIVSKVEDPPRDSIPYKVDFSPGNDGDDEWWLGDDHLELVGGEGTQSAKEGVWVVYGYNGTYRALWAAYGTEIDALRHAVEHKGNVMFLEYGKSFVA